MLALISYEIGTYETSCEDSIALPDMKDVLLNGATFAELSYIVPWNLSKSLREPPECCAAVALHPYLHLSLVVTP